MSYLSNTGLAYVISKLKSRVLLKGSNPDYESWSNVTISGVTYKTYWKITPTVSNMVYGVAFDPADGHLVRVFNNKGTFSVQEYIVGS